MHSRCDVCKPGRRARIIGIDGFDARDGPKAPIRLDLRLTTAGAIRVGGHVWSAGTSHKDAGVGRINITVAVKPGILTVRIILWDIRTTQADLEVSKVDLIHVSVVVKIAGREQWTACGIDLQSKGRIGARVTIAEGAVVVGIIEIEHER